MTEDVLIRREGHAGRITLNRPQALNALTLDMIRAIDRALRAWAADAEVAIVLIDAAGDRAFCAGGDLTAMYETGRAGDLAYGRRFWREEYRLNARIAAHPRPVIAMMQGFTMGGGVGIGCHASHRIVGETSLVSMPECGIGLVPDVGGSYLLSRAPGGIGLWMGLSGARLGPADAIAAGLADSFVPEAAWPALVQELCRTGHPAAIAAHEVVAPQGMLATARDDIDKAFATADPAACLAALTDVPGAWAERARAGLRAASPLAMACAAALIAARPRSVRAALCAEYRFVYRSMAQGDFLEGIRAALIDKDRAPRWRHATPGAVTPGQVAEMLAPLGAEELDLQSEEPDA